MSTDTLDPSAPTVAHPADELVSAITRTAAPVCVGIDPVWDRLPEVVRAGSAGRAAAISAFGRGVIEAVADVVPCVKIQSACFERYGAAGATARAEVAAAAQAADLVVILDAKRGDIGISASHYAVAASQLATPRGWTTINAYLGADGVEPFLATGGAFALVRTSNPGGDALQALGLADGRTVAEAVADLIAETGARYVGASGFSRLGAVVGATRPRDVESLRERMPEQMFLVPGFGAQGGGVEDVRRCFRPNGLGAVVTASRSVIYAGAPDVTDWKGAIRTAAEQLADTIGSAVGLR